MKINYIHIKIERTEMELGNNSLISPELGYFHLSESDFWHRFQKIKRVQDPYVRFYQICKDHQYENKRVAVKDYAANEKQEEEAVMENLQSYRKLGEVEGICKLVAYCQSESSRDISAAFAFNDFTIQEIIRNGTFDDRRPDFYRLMLCELVQVMQNAKNIGIQLQELIPSCILVNRQLITNDYKVSILYDEREKNYEKVQEGIKVFASVQKLQASISQKNDYESQECQQGIFELGLMMLDVIYEYQRAPAKGSQGFNKDLPISRINLLHKGYHLFKSAKEIQLNQALIDQKLQFIVALNQSTIKMLAELITKMIRPISDRINFENLIMESAKLSQLYQKSIKNSFDEPYFETPNKTSPKKSNDSSNKPDESLKHSDTFNSRHIKQNMISQTTVGTNNNTLTDNKTIDFNSQTRLSTLIPKQQILSQLKCHKNIINKLQDVIASLQSIINAQKKKYYDSSIYYGQVTRNTQKRNGLGIYVYTQGDIYFGIWKQNALIEGTYIFKNGQSYEGVVKNGKQGHGRYYYSNGNIYDGCWRDDIKSGHGKMIYPNGDVYDGMWSKGKKNGEGLYQYNNGAQYIGNFVNGKKQGLGTIIFPNGTKIQAYWQQTHIEGPGKVFYNNGNYFEGNYHMSQKQGEGLYIWEDTQYSGDFKKDSMEGNARIKFSQDQFYDGRIKNGKRHGHGLYKYPNGDQYSGQWKNDEKTIGLYTFREGGSFQGRFKKNQMSYGVMVYENGESYQGQFINGQRQGTGMYRNGQKQLICEGTWLRDQFVPQS